MANRSIKAITFTVVLLSIFVSLFSYEPLTFEQRVKAQEAIERVYYNHRIWPKENKTPKPPFEKMVSKDFIEKKVEDYLKKSVALEKYWYRPITGEQLQAEMDRMAKNTKDPKVLNELFEALNNDPYLIAECLTRPVLADRLIRNWYANDERFHKKTKEKAEEALKHLTPENFCSYPEGEHYTITYKLQTDGKEELYSDPEDHSIKLPEKEFYRIYNEIPEEGKISKVIEKDDCFVILHTVEKNEGLIIYDSIVFKKTSLENWLKELSFKKENVIAKSEKVYSLSPLKESQCGERWDNGILDDVPEPRAGHTAVWTGTEMIIWGGSSNEVLTTNSGGRYNPTTDTWSPTSVTEDTPVYRSLHTAIWTGSKMIIWGGWNAVSGDLNSGAIYDPYNDIWTPISNGSNCPSPRTGHSTIWTGSEMIVWGGEWQENWGSDIVYYNDGGRYNPLTDNWIEVSLTSNTPSPRAYHTAVWTGSEMIVWGGYSGDPQNYQNSGGKYNPQTDSWIPTSTSSGVPSGRAFHTAIWTGSEMIVWGGKDTDVYYLGSGGKYNPLTDSWLPTSIGSGCPTPRCNHSAIWTGSKMIVWGGEGYGCFDPSSGGIYDPLNDSWIPTSEGGYCPLGRCSFTAVWTGTEMIVWGGWGYTGDFENSTTLLRVGPLNSGARFNPEINNWIPTAYYLMPSQRENPSSVWTGTEMIIWGGFFMKDPNHRKYLDSGWRYSLATDSWTPTSRGNDSLYPQIYSVAIWTGTEMIVWGGNLVYSGARYNPLTDTWVPISTVNIPSVRYSCTGVWTGSEMIVSGGTTGGKYNPANDSWISISSNTLSDRQKHSAVWTGKEMIIWGGYSILSSLYFNDGAIYNPATDSWTPISTGANTPTARCGHTGIWTGKEMIIWGGEIGFNQATSSGALYTPDTDTWKPISEGENCPTPRVCFSSVWSGSELLIWGGLSSPCGSNFCFDAARYSPESNCWLPMTTINSPRTRYNNSTIWTGKSMIVWGGCVAVFPNNDGGIYYPWFGKPLISGGSTNPCPSPSVSLSVPGNYSSYQWNLDGVPIDGATSSTYEATVSGSYTVSVTDSEGCSGTSDPHPVTIVACIPEIIYDSKGSFTEVTGDGDSYFEKGEKWKVSVTVRNSGNTPATNVVANLTGNGIQVCNNPGVFGTISAGGTGSYEFEFLIDSNFSPCGGYVDFGLINKQCVEKTPAGNHEFNLFSTQVGEITSGVPTEVVIDATEDSWVNQALMYADTNYGSDTSLYSQQRTSQARRALIQFGLSAIPSGSVINSATLEMYATSATGSNTIELHRITSSWSEGSVTWESQPSFDSSATSTLSGINSTGWKVWDVKSLIEGYLSGTFTNCGFLLKSQTETGAQLISTTFASRENSNTSQRPVLRINYTPPPAMSCNYVGNGECLIPLPGEVAPGDNYNNALIWSEDKAAINWPAVSGVTSYKVYRGTKSTLPDLLTTELDSCLRYQGTNTSVDLSSDNPSSDADKMYWYLIVGSNSSGDGPAGNGRIINSGGSCQ